MAVHPLSAARSLCELRDWTISNLQLQKILYIGHMLHIGETSSPLISEDFEAWDYGPVSPNVYHRVRGFGSSPIRNVFHWVPRVDPVSVEFASLKQASNLTEGMSPGKLVSITHWKDGAWSQVYRSGISGIKIPTSLIADEYRKRLQIASNT